MKNIFILTGMHRSGTSLLGEFLNRSGVDLGDELLEPSGGNPHGYFEDIEIIQFHKKIVRRACSLSNKRWAVWASRIPPIREKDKEIAKEIIAKRNHTKEVWGWKEPRTCLLLHFWESAIPEAKFIFVFRDPKLVIDSNARREWSFSRNNDKFLKGWILYNECLLKFYQENKEKCVLFSIEKAIQNPQEFARLLKKRLDYDFSGEQFLTSFEEKFLQTKPKEERKVNKVLEEKGNTLYQRLLELDELEKCQ